MMITCRLLSADILKQTPTIYVNLIFKNGGLRMLILHYFYILPTLFSLITHEKIVGLLLMQQPLR